MAGSGLCHRDQGGLGPPRCPPPVPLSSPVCPLLRGCLQGELRASWLASLLGPPRFLFSVIPEGIGRDHSELSVLLFLTLCFPGETRISHGVEATGRGFLVPVVRAASSAHLWIMVLTPITSLCLSLGVVLRIKRNDTHRNTLQVEMLFFQASKERKWQCSPPSP